MTEKTLKSLINKLNKKQHEELIFLRPLSESVDYAKVWLKKPMPTDNIVACDGPKKFYFIKNREGFYVGTVYDMINDLHWFVVPKFRKQGHLTNALKEDILPHIFNSQERIEQKISISKGAIGEKNFNDSQGLAFKVGFKKTSEMDEYILSANDCINNIDYEGENTIMSEERMKLLQKRVNYLSKSLCLIQNEVEMKLGFSEHSESLEQLVNDLYSKIWRIEDSWWENKQE